MNVKNNKKAKMSVENITNAVFDFLKTSSYEELTVKDICKIAGVNRSTFYSHFDSIEDILYSICQSYITKVLKIFLKTNISYKTRLKEALVEVQERYEFFMYVFTSVPNFDIHVMDMIENQLNTTFIPNNIESEKSRLSLSFILAGFVGVGKRLFYDLRYGRIKSISLDHVVDVLYNCVNLNNPNYKVN